GNLLTETWFRISGTDPAGTIIEGWTPESRVRVRETAEDGTPLGGTIRTRLGEGVDPLTPLYAVADENSDIVGQVEPQTAVTIAEQAVLEVWYLVVGETAGGDMQEGWAPSRYIQVCGEGERGRVDRGNTGAFTTQYLQRMVNDRFF